MQIIKEQFKNKWKQEYLAELHGKHKYLSHKRSRNIVKVENKTVKLETWDCRRSL